MSRFQKVFSRIKTNFENDINAIPSKFVRFKPYFLGVIRSTYTIITASSGIGKSRFTKWAYMFSPLEFVKNSPELNIKLKIFYFSLEENEDKFIRSLISTELYKRYQLNISARDLLDLDKENSKLTQDIIDKIQECGEYIDSFLEDIEIVDSIRNAYGIYKYVREYAAKNGKFYLRGKEVDVTIAGQSWDSYIPNNREEYVIVITDHISLLEPEKGMSKHEAIGKFSSEYCLMMRDKFGYTIVNVQQQSSDKEKQEFTIKGQSIESKLEPSLDGLGDNKTTQRDADFVYGLFAPERYEIEEHRGYDITKLKDKYRQLKLLKDRDGEANKRIGLYFQGAVNEFSELPKAEDFRCGIATYTDYI